MKRIPLALFLLLSSASLARASEIGEGLDRRSRKKLEFLLAPVFSPNQEKLLGKKKVETRPGPEPVTEKEAQKETKAAAKVLQSVPRANVIVPPADGPGQEGKKNDGICGANEYLGSFCFYKLGANDWLLCTSKWGDCTKRTESGCFSPSTRLRTPEGWWRSAGTFRPGDSIWDPVAGRSRRVLRLVVGEESQALVAIVVGASVLTVTREHPLLTERGWRAADEIGLEDRLLLASGESAPIESLRSSSTKTLVVNFILEGDDGGATVDAEGVIAGAYEKQRALGRLRRGSLP